MYDALELINAAKDANYLVEWITPDPYENAYLWANVKDYK